jgi:nicotinate-nucleotide adenylyltransferase
MAGRKVGVFGGTFDPPHIGHLVTAIDVVEVLGLDLVLMVVANEPWQKVGSRRITPAADRLEMVRTAVAGVDRVEASDIEIRRGGSSYTVDTLQELRREDPEVELHLVLGSDAAAGLDTWERAEALGDLCRIVVVDRPGASTDVPGGFDVERVNVPRLEVSSTELRARAGAGRSLRFLVPEGVIALVRERDLYGFGDDDDGEG